MLIKIDPKGAARFSLINEWRGNGGNEHRKYYAENGDRRALLVLRNGLDLAEITGLTVDSSIGWEQGRPRFSRMENVGKRHTKITVYRIVYGKHDRAKILSGILVRAPRIKR